MSVVHDSSRLGTILRGAITAQQKRSLWYSAAAAMLAVVLTAAYFWSLNREAITAADAVVLTALVQRVSAETGRGADVVWDVVLSECGCSAVTAMERHQLDDARRRLLAMLPPPR